MSVVYKQPVCLKWDALFDDMTQQRLGKYAKLYSCHHLSVKQMMQKEKKVHIMCFSIQAAQQPITSEVRRGGGDIKCTIEKMK